MKFDAGDRLGMAAVQVFGESEHGGQRTHHASLFALQLTEPLLTAVRHDASMIPGNERHDLDLIRIEPSQVAVADQVIRMFVMADVADVHADIVEK